MTRKENYSTKPTHSQVKINRVYLNKSGIQLFVYKNVKTIDLRIKKEKKLGFYYEKFSLHQTQ